MRVISLGRITFGYLFIPILLMIPFISSCSTSTVVDEQKSSFGGLSLNKEEKIVIMGRRHGSSMRQSLVL